MVEDKLPSEQKRKKVVILEEKSYESKVMPPPNLLPWFQGTKRWDRLHGPLPVTMEESRQQKKRED